MKTTEAPEKIYMPTELLSEDWSKHIEGCDIEYVRKDVFIERVRKAMISLFTFPFMSEEELKMIEVKIDLICDILKSDSLPRSPRSSHYPHYPL